MEHRGNIKKQLKMKIHIPCDKKRKKPKKNQVKRKVSSRIIRDIEEKQLLSKEQRQIKAKGKPVSASISLDPSSSILPLVSTPVSGRVPPHTLPPVSPLIPPLISLPRVLRPRNTDPSPISTLMLNSHSLKRIPQCISYDAPSKSEKLKQKINGKDEDVTSPYKRAKLISKERRKYRQMTKSEDEESGTSNYIKLYKTNKANDDEMIVVKHIITIEQVCIKKKKDLNKKNLLNKRKCYNHYNHYNKHVKTFSDYENQDFSSCEINSKVPVLQNGNILRSQVFIIYRQQVMVINTCAFDACIQSLLVAYRDSVAYKNYVDFTPNKILNFIKLMSEVDTTPDVYKERAIILSTLFPIKNGIINCVTNITQLIKQLLPNAVSYKILQQCSICDWKDQREIVVLEINIRLLFKYGIVNLQKAVTEAVIPAIQKCSQCNNENVCTTFRTGAHLFIDIEMLQWSNFAYKNNYPVRSKTILLSEIPLNIIFLNSNYKLVSCIEYVDKFSDDIDEYSSNKTGHYVAYCHRKTGNWEMYDDLKRYINICRTISGKAFLRQRKITLLIFIKQD